MQLIKEELTKAINGYLMLVLLFIVLAAFTASVFLKLIPLAVPLFLVLAILVSGFFIINPKESSVLSLFGKYVGTVKQDGFHWANPFYTKKKVSLRARNLNGEKVKVNDALGNPIIISVVVVWRVNDTAKAIFEVDDYDDYVTIQSEAAMRTLANAYPYDNFDDEQVDLTLRDGGGKVNEMLELQLTERLSRAGIQIIEARISHLAYAQEIAQAMLKRQQATAIVAARFKIVEGAVSMVEMALDQLKKQGIVDLDEDKKAAMVSNLMVVLCSDKDANPIVNAGTLYQ